MRHLPCLSCLASLCLLAATGLSPAAAAPVAYSYDPAGSAIGFEADFGKTPIRGRMPVTDITLSLDFERVANSHVTVTLDAAGASANIPFAAQAMKGESVLATRAHPEIRFESTKVAARGEGKAAITGALTIRGVTHEVTLDATLYRPQGSAAGARDDLSILLTGDVSRAAYGATGFADQVGDRVRLKILAHIRRAG